jgi:signal transduction histidine kinase
VKSTVSSFRQPNEAIQAEAIQAEQIRLLYSNAGYGYLATAINATLLTLVLGSVISPLVTASWLAYMLSVTMLRWVLARRFYRAQPAPQCIGSWGVAFGVGVGFAGGGWGIAGVLLFPESSLNHQAFLALVLGGMVAGAVGLLSARMMVFLVFAGLTVVPIILRLLVHGGQPGMLMAGTGVLLTLVMAITAWKFNRVITSSLMLRFENSDLVATLTSEKAEVEQLNMQLHAEMAERQSIQDALLVAQKALEGQVTERSAQLQSAIIQIHDEIAHRQQLDELLQQAQKMETVGRLAGGIAHDFSNMLTVILGYTALARTTAPVQVELQNYLEGVHNAAQRAADLTQQLLAFSRRQIINPETVNLNDLLREMTPMLQRVIKENIELVTLLSPDLWATWADPLQIERVIVNLVVNARDALLEGGSLEGGSIVIATENVQVDQSDFSPYPEVSPGNYALLVVSDTGSGIPEAIRGQIFEPFFTTKEAGLGTGLGLSSCYGIIAQAGGCMTVDSEVGRGTSMRVFLPRIESETRAGEGKDVSTIAARGEETVLVVEDEPTVRALISQVLQDHGYRVLEAVNGVDAWGEILRNAREPVDLLLTDIVMPRMGGVELADRIRALVPDIRILFMSGYADEIEIDEMLAKGKAFINKPFLPESLVARVRQTLDQTPQFGTPR